MKAAPRTVRLLLTFAICAALVQGLFVATPAAAAVQPQDGALRIEAIYGPNLIVDSNVESPSTYAPRSATFAAKVCNTGAATLTDIFVSIGNYDLNNDGNGIDSTPGIYPAKTHAPLVGTFSLTHEGGSAGALDASRYMFTLTANECRFQYWLFSYPRLDNLGNSVTGGIKPNDDLKLDFDMWASATDGGTPRKVNITHTVTMRNEISASANKIWPNGDNKVPQQYLDAIAATFGWGTFIPGGGTSVYPGTLVSTQGVWYDLGNVGFGFDNNGDFVPDHNAFLQPIGDPSIYDPGCFRLVRTYGILIVKLVGGGEKLIPFLDNLYFQNIPDNTGTVGLVFYEYVALDGACRASLSPYQEVASGYDNEKFNADFGYAMPPMQSVESAVTIDKTVDKATVGPTLPETVSYAIGFVNPGPVNVGAFSLALPLVISDTIPLGTVYVAGSATASNTLPAGVSAYKVLYSTNNGQTWTATEPPANTVTTIQWWLGADMPANTSGTVRYQTVVPATYTATRPPVVPNTGALSFGNSPPFAEDTVTTVVLGNNSLSGTVFSDNGSGGLFANAVRDTGELGIANVTVSLYLDTNGNGKVDAGEPLVGTQISGGTGAYSFANLPDGNFVVVVNAADTDIPAGYTNTTAIIKTAALDPTHLVGTPVTQTGIDFGFAPALTVTKALLPSGTTAIFEGDTVQYTIDLANKLPGIGSPVPVNCSQTTWAQVDSTPVGGGGNSNFLNLPGGIGASGPNQTYASSAFANTSDRIHATTFSTSQPGTITKVEALFSVYSTGTFVDDTAVGEIAIGGVSIGTLTYLPASLNPFVGQSSQGLLVWNATALRPWSFSDFTGTTLELRFNARKVGGADGRTIFLDAMGFRVTTNQICAPTPATTINPLPLTDTYDPTKLQFVSAVPPVDSSAPLGTLNWNNLGPVYPGGTAQVLVTFRALGPGGVNVTNTATVSTAKFANGTPANTGTSAVTVPINPTGSIAGVLWNDLNNNGWIATTGFEGTDTRIPGTTVTLFGCQVGGVMLFPAPNTTRDCTNVANGGTWVQMATQVTDSTGAYSFGALRNGYYYTAVTQSTIASTGVTQRGDPNTQPGLCAVCDNLSNLTTENLGTGIIGSITAANDVANVNFGYNVQPILYGKVWEDVDGDGIRDPEEPLLTGSVSIYNNANCTNPPAPTVVALVNGEYHVGGLTASTYCIQTNTASLPAGGTWTQTGETDGTINNQIVQTLTAGQISGSHDFGFRRSGSSSIGDTLYYDWSGDGIQQPASEEGIKNVTVRLYRDANNNGVIDAGSDPFVAATVTSINGTYLFSSLPAGNYIVAVDTADPDFPASMYQTADPNEAGVCVICDNQSRVAGVDGTSAYLTHDFGYKLTGGGSIGDTVWYDINADGSQSGTQETGLSQVTVNLQVDLNGDGTFVTIATAATDVLGKYLFSNLPAGTYRVVVDTADADLPNDVFGNNLAPTTPTTYNLTLPTNTSNLSADFGFAPLGAIGDTIYWDANANGTQDWNESGINGVLITLCRDLNSDGDCADAGETVAATTTTATTTGEAGKYLFSGLSQLPAGATYLVSVGPIPGSPILTADPNADGVVCAPLGAAVCDGIINVNVLPSNSFMGADFGYQPSVIIGDTLWVDSNGNGIKEPNEAGIPNITINLCPTVGPCLTTVTDVDGSYFFQNIPNDTYTVSVLTSDPDFPAGLTATFDADATANGSTTVVVSGGAVTSVGGTACTSCGLTADFAYQYVGTLSLSGTVCRDGSEANRVCGTGPTGVSLGTGEIAYTSTLYLIRWVDDGDGVVESGETTTVGSTTTSNGDYSFTSLPAGTYLVALAPPADNLAMVTQLGDTPATRVVVTPSTGSTTSAYQVVALTTNVVGVDFAFQSIIQSDFGDLPNSYSTKINGAPEGPSHQISGGPALHLGALGPDTELNGTPSAGADADGADEDGVAFNGTWFDGVGTGEVTVTVQGSGWLIGWIDFDKNGRFDQPNEMIINQAVSTGTNTYTFDIPNGTSGYGSRNLYSRFRIFSAKPIIPALAYTGTASGGEVEDYLTVLASPTAVTMVSFSAQTSATSIRVRWQTSAEENTAGYQLYRSTDGERASAVLLTPELIPAHGPGIGYVWTDSAVVTGVTYSYWVAAIDSDGSVAEHGPVSSQIAAVYQVFLPAIGR